MSRFRKWADEVGTNVVAEIIAAIVIGVVTILVATIYTLYSSSPELALLIILIVLVLINFLFGLYRSYSSNRFFQEIQKLIEDSSRQSQNFQEVVLKSPLFPQQIEQNISTRQRFDHFLPVTRRYLDEESQKIVIEFTNQGDSIFYVRQVLFSSNILQDSAIKFRRRNNEHYRRPILDFDRNYSEIQPGGVFRLEIELEEIWRKEKIESKWGNLAYLYLFVEYRGIKEDMQYSI